MLRHLEARQAKRMVSRTRQKPRADREIAVRDARQRDLPALPEAYNDAVLRSQATFDLEPHILGQRRKWLAEHGPSFPLVVAEGKGRVQSYASLSRFRDKPGCSRSAEDSVYVHRDFQGKGVGKLLMNEILARAVPGFVYAGNFKEVGFKFSRWQDVAFYQLFLQSATT